MTLQIEIASFKAWPAFEQADDNGWVSRYADGYTKRANSVTILRPNSNSLERQIKDCEQRYNIQGLPCIFRLLSFNDNHKIESLLNAKGYKDCDHTLVLSKKLESREIGPVKFDLMTVEEWMAYYCQLSGKDTKNHRIHMNMLKNIKQKHLLAVLKKNEQIVSCGLAVISDGLCGLFDIVTHPGHRKKGYGTELISRMLRWATQNNSNFSFIQVVADNIPAIKLYQALGYKLSYEYKYKIQNYIK